MTIQDQKRFVSDYVDAIDQDLRTLSATIHANPELAFKEYKAQKEIVRVLKQYGFNPIIEGVGQLDTAIITSYGEGYPVIAICAEYDALINGHACGHNLIATSAVGASIALKKAMEQFKLPGTVKFIGCPAEEEGGGKALLIDAGAFDGVDMAMLMHPTSAKSRIAGECKSFDGLNIYFHGKEAHANTHPEKGINALDAANLFAVAVGLLRQQLHSDIGVSYVIKDGGVIESLIPQNTHIECSVSSFSLKRLVDATEKVKNCAKGAALATGCSVDIQETVRYEGRIVNEVLGELARKNLEDLGEPVMEGFPLDNGGTDFGNVERIIPSVNPYLSLLPERKISGHTDEFRELAISERSNYVNNVSSKLMAQTALDVLNDLSLLEKAKAELKALQEKDDF